MFVFVIYTQLCPNATGRVSLQLVTAIRSSVSLLYSFCLKVQPLATVKSSGSQVAAVYLIWVNSVPLPDHQLVHSGRGSYIPVNHFSSTAEEIGVGTGYLSLALDPEAKLAYSEMKFPSLVNFTRRVVAPLFGIV